MIFTPRFPSTENPQKSTEHIVSVRLLDVNDNVPKLTESQAFICVKKPEPVIIKAYDEDSAPFSEPFTFTFAHGKKSPNWELQAIDGNTCNIYLKKKNILERLIFCTFRCDHSLVCLCASCRYNSETDHEENTN